MNNQMIKDLFRRKSIESMLQTAADEEKKEGSSLKKNLGVADLTALGIAAIIGAGIFSTIGTAAVNGGPAVSVLFIFTAIACGFSAMSYAQFASSIPLSGSAYTYAYASFGELIAWIIGWDLIMEYAVGNIAVAISWSDYFTAFLGGFHIHVPEFLCVDYLSAFRGYSAAAIELSKGISLDKLPALMQESYKAWTGAPQIFGLHFIADIPAFTIVLLITALVYIGIRETKIAGNIMVLLKLVILMIVIGIGAFYVNPKHWSPFAPNGIGGVLKGVSGVFFAYIGFDAISTTAEECKNPQRDLPRSMILSLAITTVLYVVISLVLTGMVSYKELAVGDPLAYVFRNIHLTWLSGFIAFGAIIAMASVLLVFQVGQPRIWMSMSRDGLLPHKFAKVHRRFKTPSFATIITGIFVSVPCLFLNLTEVTDLTSIGTLFAFVLVSGGILILDGEKSQNTGGFKVPYFNSRYILPAIWAGTLLILFIVDFDAVVQFFTFRSNNSADSSVWSDIKESIPMLIFIIAAAIISFFAVWKKWSIIPVVGLLTNLYLMSNLGITNWLRFLIWLAVGLIIYFSYGRFKSKLRIKENQTS
jgi:amino acid transporter